MTTQYSYIEKLKDPRWQKKRLEIFQRDKFTCQKCGDKESTLNVHHKKYFKGKEPWECPNKYLITVCSRCHKLMTDFRDYNYSSFQILKIKSNSKKLYLLCCSINKEKYIFCELDIECELKSGWMIEEKETIEGIRNLLKNWKK